MNPTEYYRTHAGLHTGGDVEADLLRDGVLGGAPSETEIALWWLRGLERRGSLLDVGCGGLRLLVNAGPLFQERHGVDLVPAGNWGAHPELRTGCCNLDEGPLAYPDGRFDAVACLMVLEHVFDPFHGVRELRRVCHPQGRVVIGVPNLAGVKRRWELLRGRLPVTSSQGSFHEGSWDGFHLHNFTRRSLEWLLRREGLEPVSWTAQGRWQWLKRMNPGLFGNDLMVMARPSEPVSGAALGDPW